MLIKSLMSNVIIKIGPVVFSVLLVFKNSNIRYLRIPVYRESIVNVVTEITVPQ